MSLPADPLPEAPKPAEPPKASGDLFMDSLIKLVELHKAGATPDEPEALDAGKKMIIAGLLELVESARAQSRIEASLTRLVAIVERLHPEPSKDLAGNYNTPMPTDIETYLRRIAEALEHQNQEAFHRIR